MHSVKNLFSIFAKSALCCTAHPICRFPEMKLRGPRSQFLHSCICSQIGRPILGNINRSQIYECGNWETEHYNYVREITRPCSFYEYINRNQTFIMNSHRPFICSVHFITKKGSNRRFYENLK